MRKGSILSLADRTGRANAVPRSHRPRCRLPLSSLPLAAMSLDYEIAVGVLLFVGHSVSTSELPVNGVPTDADFNWRLGGERAGATSGRKRTYRAPPRMLILTIAV